MSNIIDKKLFKQIFGHIFEALANKLINTANKGENQIIVNNVEKNKDKIYEKENTSYGYSYGDRCVDLIDARYLILKFSEKI